MATSSKRACINHNGHPANTSAAEESLLLSTLADEEW